MNIQEEIKQQTLQDNHRISLEITEEVLTGAYDYCVDFLKVEHKKAIVLGISIPEVKAMCADKDAMRIACVMEIIAYWITKYNLKPKPEGK